METTTTCSICLEEFENNSSLHMLNCGHIFHYKCTKKWLSISKNCPLCKRFSLLSCEKEINKVGYDMFKLLNMEEKIITTTTIN